MGSGERMAKVTGFPQEVVSQLPRIVLYGSGRIFIEQHRGVVTYQKDIICFQTAAGMLTIRGQALELIKYTRQDAVIRGEITSVFYPEKGGA